MKHHSIPLWGNCKGTVFYGQSLLWPQIEFTWPPLPFNNWLCFILSHSDATKRFLPITTSYSGLEVFLWLTIRVGRRGKIDEVQDGGGGGEEANGLAMEDSEGTGCTGCLLRKSSNAHVPGITVCTQEGNMALTWHATTLQSISRKIRAHDSFPEQERIRTGD